MKSNKFTLSEFMIHLTFIIGSLMCIIPFLLIVAISFSSEADIVKYGYSLIPKNFSFDAYNYVFKNPAQIINSYKVTIFVTIAGTVLGVILMSMLAYTISRKTYALRNGLNFYIYFTMLFSGGLVPSYILITQYLNMGDTIWVLFVPLLIAPFHIFLLRTFFSSLPEAIIESAKIDGASEFKILFQLILPLSIPALATVGFLTALNRWNDWYMGMLYIRNDNLLPLQTLLQKILANLQFLTSTMREQGGGGMQIESLNLPSETVRMALLVIATGPMLFVFPFFQKYFVSGLTVGAVKG